jgi:hypothetical protein
MRTRIQLHLSIALASGLVGYASAKGDWIAIVIVALISKGAIEIAVASTLKWRLTQLRREEELFRLSLSSMPVDEARQRALSALANHKKCRSFARAATSLPPAVPVTVREIFSIYERVEFDTGDRLELLREEVGYIYVGKTYDEADLIIRDVDQGLFEWDRRDHPSQEETPDYPSIFHWIAHNTGE